MRSFVIRDRVQGLRLCALICAFGSGCGSGDKIPELFPVTGKVTFQGRPVPGATVVFIPDTPAPKGKPKEAAPIVVRPIGETDDDGNYALVWNEKADGAPQGKYKVAITAVAPLGEGDDDEAKRPNPIPDNYGNPAKSGLTAVVKDEDNVADFDLK